MIVSLDLALTTGVARCDCGQWSTTVWDLRPDDDPTPGKNRSIAPAISLGLHLDIEHNSTTISRVVLESALTRHATTAWIQNSLQVSAMLWCHRHGVTFSRWTPAEWKGALLGSVFVKREKYHHEAQRKWPNLDIQTDDEAAAMWLLEMELRQR